MPRTRLATAASTAVIAVLACTTPALAETEHAEHVDLPLNARVVDAPAKRLSVRDAAKLRQRAQRTGRFPAAPRLKVRRGQLERLAEDRRRSEPQAGHDELAPADRMFGTESPYSVKRDPVLRAIQNFNATNVPRNGGTYTSPALYEVQHGGALPGCNASVYNGVYCGGVNSIGWSMGWTADAFRLSGDMRWATLIAHEYGHASQRFLNIRGGWMGYTLYSESFADCMAGAFLWYAHANRMTDAVGRGDYNEFRDAFVALASPTTELNNHGTFQWRYALATYGWNVGFDGCTRWARSIDGV